MEEVKYIDEIVIDSGRGIVYGTKVESAIDQVITGYSSQMLRGNHDRDTTGYAYKLSEEEARQLYYQHQSLGLRLALVSK